MSNTDSLKISPAPTLVEEPVQSEPAQPELSTSRKLALLAVFCLAQFLDVFNNSALLPGVPQISEDTGMTTEETVWIFSAYQLTFAAFLLLVSSSPCLKSLHC